MILVAPVEATLRTMFCRVIAFKGSSKCSVRLSLPDVGHRLLEDISEYPLFFVFSSALVPKGSEAAGEDVAAGCDIGQRVRTLAARPGALTEVAYQALYWCC